MLESAPTRHHNLPRVNLPLASGYIFFRRAAGITIQPLVETFAVMTYSFVLYIYR